MTILDQIVATKWSEIQRSQYLRPLGELESQLATAPPVRDFATALRPSSRQPNSSRQPCPVQIIAEVKKASPSAGVIRAEFDPVSIARIYAEHGAAAISVLTDEQYFQGHLTYLTAIRSAVSIPLLRKEFILDRYQLVEARVAGADAVLLIAEILPGNRLRELHDEAKQLGMQVLVELHDAEQLPRVLDTGAELIGVNNRDLRTFQTRLDHTLELMPKIPASVTVVSESGIRTHDDLKRLAAAGVRAVLVGESLMRAPDIGAALDQLRGIETICQNVR